MLFESGSNFNDKAALAFHHSFKNGTSALFRAKVTSNMGLSVATCITWTLSSTWRYVTVCVSVAPFSKTVTSRQRHVDERVNPNKQDSSLSENEVVHYILKQYHHVDHLSSQNE